MKKILYFISTILLLAGMLSLSSCLKDNYVDFTKDAPVVDFPLGGTQFFGADAITEAPDTDANGTIVRQFAVNVGAPKALGTPTKITLAVDFSIVTSYNASQTAVTYLPMPSNAYSFTATTVTVPAGQQYVTTSVTFYKNKLDPSKSYMLPIKIVSAGGLTISGNMGIHYYHFIGNDFAGAYLWDYTRTPAAGNFTGQPTTLFPVTPLQFEMNSGYYTGTVRYEVTFTKGGTPAAPTYTNFAVTLNSDDVANILTPAGIAVTAPPVFTDPTVTPTSVYTYAQALKIFDFTYSVLGSSGARVVEDRFYKP
jgi:hypothetical protein